MKLLIFGIIMALSALIGCATNSPQANINSVLDSKKLSHLEKAIYLKEESDKGNPDATFMLGLYLIKYSPEPEYGVKYCNGEVVNPLIKGDYNEGECKIVGGNINSEEFKKWKNIGNKYTANSLITQAANSNSQLAIKFLCGFKDDGAAPRQMRMDAEKWCAKIN